MHSFTIKDLENLSGIKAHTIRIWEQRYSFLKPSRTGTNIRFYSNSELKKILNVALLNKYGFKISHIDRMNEEEMKERILSLNQLEAQQERIVNTLIQAMVEIDLEGFERALQNFISVRGIEKTIFQIIFPFLEKIGVLWMTNHINPAQEHLVTNLIRQKIISGIDGVNNRISINKTILLFLPEGEHHEIGLLFMNYMLRSKGVKTIYLGSSTPLHDIEYVAKHTKPDYLYTHLTAVAPRFNLEKFIAAASKNLSGIPLIISGPYAQSYNKKAPAHAQFKRSFQEVTDFINSLK